MVQRNKAPKRTKVIKEVKNNPKAFYKYANTYRKFTSKIGPLKVGSKYEDDPKRMANIIARQYKSVFTIPKDISDVLLKPPKNENSLSESTIGDKDIKQAIVDMAITSAPEAKAK